MSPYSRKPRSGRSSHADRHISVRGVRHREPDVRKLARALIALAMAQAEADAQAQAEADASQRTAPDEDHPHSPEARDVR